MALYNYYESLMLAKMVVWATNSYSNTKAVI